MVSPSLFILAFSVSRCLQCLVSTLTQGGRGGHLFGLTCSVVLWEGRDTANKRHWCVWGILVADGPHWVCHSWRQCVLPGSTLLRLQGAVQATVPRGPCVSCTSQVWAAQVLGCPVRAQTWMGCVFRALPRSKQLRRPGAWQQGRLRWAMCPIHLPSSWCLVARVCRENSLRHAVHLLWGADLRLWHSWQMSTVQDPRKMKLSTGSLLTVWWKMLSLGPRLQ